MSRKKIACKYKQRGKEAAFVPALHWDTTGAGHDPHAALVPWWDSAGPHLCSPALHSAHMCLPRGGEHLGVGELGSVSGSKYFRLEMLWGRGRLGLGSGEVMSCPVYPTPHTYISALQRLLIPGTPE